LSEALLALLEKQRTLFNSDKLCVALTLSSFLCVPSQRASKSFEIVFASSDENEDAFQEYFEHMPWHAIPFEGTSALREALSQCYGATSLPCLVLLDKHGSVINKDAGENVVTDREGLQFPWKA